MRTPKDYFKRYMINLSLKECIMCGMYANYIKHNTRNFIDEEIDEQLERELKNAED